MLEGPAAPGPPAAFSPHAAPGPPAAPIPEGKKTSTLRESWLVAVAASLLSVLSLAYCAKRHLLLLYGDAVAHLHIARRIVDSLNPGFHQLGSVWLPLPHILLLPFVLRMEWWQNAIPAAVPSMLCYVAGCVGLYRLARLWLEPAQASVAAAFYGLNPGLLYMQTTAMTEPLFLAEMIWSALLLAEHGRALEAGKVRRAGRTLIAAGLVMTASVYTRYDGWIYATFAWLIVAVGLFANRLGWQRWRERVTGAFVLFTVMLAIAPLVWIAYNARQFGDPLDFLRGPYSAKAIEARTATPGAGHYPGWHNMPVAALYFLKAAEGGAVPIAVGNILLCLATAGAVYGAGYNGAVSTGVSATVPPGATKRFGTPTRAALLLWMPVPFYAYSIAYGSVPIFIPRWWPHSWYNTRYGMEMLPAFALSLAMAIALITRLTKARNQRWIISGAFALIVLNAVAVTRSTPLVLQEAFANSETRIPFERALARALLALPKHDGILMYTSAHIGALQQAGIPLKGTINEGDYYQWKASLADPAGAQMVSTNGAHIQNSLTHSSLIVVAIDGDPVAQAVAAHQKNLRLIATICSTGQPCARIYQSTLAINPGNQP